MSHPFERIPPGKGARVFLPLFAATLLVMVVLNVMDAPTRNATAPQGIVSLELARTVEKAFSIVVSWDDNQRIRTGWGLGFDYLFMPLYSTTIAFACVWAGRMLGKQGSKKAGEPGSIPLTAFAGPPVGAGGRWLAWGLWLAALFDAGENAALFVVLLGPVASPWPQLAFWCASLKFALLAAGLAYAAAGAVAFLLRRE